MKIGLARLLRGYALCLALAIALTLGVSLWLHGAGLWQALCWSWVLAAANGLLLILGLHRGLGEHLTRFAAWTFGTILVRLLGLPVAALLIMHLAVPLAQRGPLVLYAALGCLIGLGWEILELKSVSQRSIACREHAGH